MEIFFYILVLSAYIPGLIGIFKFKFYGKFPLLLFCFFGMFVFHALGSILIFYKQFTSTGVPLFSYEYVAMLIVQAVIFYAIAWPYIFYRKDIEYTLAVEKKDYFIIPPIIIIIGFILLMYRMNVGSFLLFDLLSRDINIHNASTFRSEKSFGLSSFGIYELGFIVFPALLASHVLLISLINKRFSLFNIAVILLCFVPIVLLGQKSGILQVVVILYITYIIYLGAGNKAPGKAFTIKSALLLLAALIPTAIIYVLYYGRGAGYFHIAKELAYRIFGSYSETLAATVPMARDYGWLGGNTLPVLAAPGNYMGLDVLMHYYIFGGEGAAPVPAVGEGYVNFGWPGFIAFTVIYFVTLIGLQEVLQRIKSGLFSYTIMAWFAYLSMYTTLIGLFSTLFSIQRYILLILMIGLVGVVELFISIQGKLAHPLGRELEDIDAEVERELKGNTK
jgi:hypothetical protein